MTGKNKKTLPDKALIEECKNTEDNTPKELLYNRYYGYAFSIALRYSASTELASEVVNDSFMKAFGKIHMYRSNEPFKNWLRRIVINTAIDHYRKEKKHLSNIPFEGEASLPDNYEGIISRLTVKDILSLLENLTDYQRVVFNLYEIEKYSHKEIAEKLGISVSTSRSYLSRAKTNLQKLFIVKFGEAYE